MEGVRGGLPAAGHPPVWLPGLGAGRGRPSTNMTGNVQTARWLLPSPAAAAAASPAASVSGESSSWSSELSGSPAASGAFSCRPVLQDEEAYQMHCAQHQAPSVDQLAIPVADNGVEVDQPGGFPRQLRAHIAGAGVWSSQSNAAGMAAREEEHIGEGGWQQLAGGARLPAQLGMAERQAAPCEVGQRHADGSMQQRRHVGAHPNRQAQLQQWQATVPVYVPQRVAAQADATAACTKCQQWQTSAAAAKSSWQDAEQRCQEFKQHAGNMAQHAKACVQQLAAVQAQLQQQGSTLRMEQQSRAVAEAAVEQLQKQLAESTTAAQAMSKELAAVQGNVYELQKQHEAQLAELQRQHEALLAEVQRQHEAELAELQERLGLAAATAGEESNEQASTGRPRTRSAACQHPPAPEPLPPPLHEGVDSGVADGGAAAAGQAMEAGGSGEQEAAAAEEAAHPPMQPPGQAAQAAEPAAEGAPEPAAAPAELAAVAPVPVAAAEAAPAAPAAQGLARAVAAEMPAAAALEAAAAEPAVFGPATAEAVLAAVGLAPAAAEPAAAVVAAAAAEAAAPEPMPAAPAAAAAPVAAAQPAVGPAAVEVEAAGPAAAAAEAAVAVGAAALSAAERVAATDGQPAPQWREVAAGAHADAPSSWPSDQRLWCVSNTASHKEDFKRDLERVLEPSGGALRINHVNLRSIGAGVTDLRDGAALAAGHSQDPPPKGSQRYEWLGLTLPGCSLRLNFYIKWGDNPRGSRACIPMLEVNTLEAVAQDAAASQLWQDVLAAGNRNGAVEALLKVHAKWKLL